MIVSKTLLTDLYGPFSRSVIFLILFAFFSRMHGAKADMTSGMYAIETCGCEPTFWQE